AWRSAVAHAERWIAVAYAAAERSRHFPHRAPDFQAAVSLAKRDRFLNCLTPRAYIFKGDCPQIDITENRLNLPPAAPPIFARPRCLALPLVCAPVTTECLTE